MFALVLLGGFVFTSKWYPTKYYAVRSDGYRLVFISAIAGAVFLFAATILTSKGIVIPGGQWIDKHWHEIVRIRDSGKAVLAFLLAVCLWWPSNLLSKWDKLSFLGDDAAIRREIERKGNPLEVLLAQAQDFRTLVSVTVQNGKVYIGRVEITFNPALKMEALKLVLSRSGHRDTNTQEMVLDIDYDKTHSAVREYLIGEFQSEVIRAADRNPRGSRDEWIDTARRVTSENPKMRQYEIVIPVSEIQSINIFDVEIYDRFFAPRKDRQGTEEDRISSTQG